MRAVVFAVATLIGLNAIGTRAQEFRPLRIGPVAARVTGPTMDMPYELAKHPALQRPAGVSRAVALPLTSLTETWYLNALCSQIGKHFNDKSVGYQVVVVLPDGKWCGSAGGMARQSPDQDARAMTFEDKITIASVSKTITAAAMLHAMTEKKVSVDTKISPYLPDDWAQGPNINTITFRELFTHKSGFRCGDKYGGWALLFDGLRKCILDGVNLSDKVQLYRNENYALMRILLHQVLYVAPRVIAIPFAVKSGEDFAVAPASPQNKMQMPGKLPHPSTPQPPKWSGGDYAAFYINYVNQVVFAPIGLPQLYCKPTDAEPALSYKSASSDAYDFSSVQPGEIWGDMTLFCGSQGWNLSAHQLATFMHGLTQSAGIVPTSVMQRMEDENLGLWYNDNGNGLLEPWRISPSRIKQGRGQYARSRIQQWPERRGHRQFEVQG